MRLTVEEVEAIRAAAREAFGAGAVVRVFGSRADDVRRGGDLDLHVETEPGGGTIEAEARFRAAIGPALDDLKVDIVFRERGGQLPRGDRALSDGGAATIFRDNFAAAYAVAQRLGKSHRQLAGLFPLSPASLPDLGDEEQEAVDAFLKRFEQLVSTIQDTLFRGLAVLEGEPLAGRARRDVVELMERLGALSSSRRFGEIAVTRDRLAHLYPADPERQGANLNAAYAATPDLLATLDGVRDYATAKGRADLSGFAPVGAGGDPAAAP